MDDTQLLEHMKKMDMVDFAVDVPSTWEFAEQVDDTGYFDPPYEEEGK